MARYLSLCFVLVLLAGCDGAGDTEGAAPGPASDGPATARGPARERAFVYAVRGRARGVEVTYVDVDGSAVRKRVDTPWTSGEMTAPADAQLRLRALAPRGASIECVLKHRRLRGRYGGNGSGESSHIGDAPHRCDLDLVSPS